MCKCKESENRIEESNGESFFKAVSEVFPNMIPNLETSITF